MKLFNNELSIESYIQVLIQFWAKIREFLKLIILLCIIKSKNLRVWAMIWWRRVLRIYLIELFEKVFIIKMIQILKIYILKSFQAKNKIRQILIFIDQII